MTSPGNPTTAGTIAFTYPSYRLFQTARFFIVLATEMQSVAIGWQVYEITRNKLDLGLVGLWQFLPGILLFLVSGHTADRYDRRRILTIGYAGFAVCSALLLTISLRHIHSIYLIYGVVVMVGIVRCFNAPASRAILPLLVPEEQFRGAFAWASIIFEAATILGPAVGGLIYGIFRTPSPVYATAMIAAAAAALSMLGVIPKFRPRAREPFSARAVLAGLHYIWREKMVLGSISLDMFAVLLGGAVYLLPAFASDILHTGPLGLGLLRCAPAIGAAVTALLLAHRPLGRNSGAKMLWCVAGFGVATILFGISHSMVLSMVALMLVGATDMVSVVIRGILIQLVTPNDMRGRVNAVDMIFIGTSNELGGFESGATAQLLGAIPAVILGGIGAIVVTAACAALFPELRKLDELPSAESVRELPAPMVSD
jgi:MFS family permease